MFFILGQEEASLSDIQARLFLLALIPQLLTSRHPTAELEVRSRSYSMQKLPSVHCFRISSAFFQNDFNCEGSFLRSLLFSSPGGLEQEWEEKKEDPGNEVGL